MHALPLSAPVSVPFCRFPGSLSQSFDPATCLRSDFQVRFLVEVASRPDFDYFVTTMDRGDQFIVAPEFRCAFSLMWYTTGGQCFAARVGIDRVVREWAVGKPGTPAPLDSPVYRTRMLGDDAA
jgi:hypothetical protein